jgi:hypothetical protein
VRGFVDGLAALFRDAGAGEEIERRGAGEGREADLLAQVFASVLRPAHVGVFEIVAAAHQEQRGKRGGGEARDERAHQEVAEDGRERFVVVDDQQEAFEAGDGHVAPARARLRGGRLERGEEIGDERLCHDVEEIAADAATQGLAEEVAHGRGQEPPGAQRLERAGVLPGRVQAFVHRPGVEVERGHVEEALALGEALVQELGAAEQGQRGLLHGLGGAALGELAGGVLEQAAVLGGGPARRREMIALRRGGQGQAGRAELALDQAEEIGPILGVFAVGREFEDAEGLGRSCAASTWSSR